VADSGRIKIVMGKFFLVLGITTLLLTNPLTVKYFFSTKGTLSRGVFFTLMIFTLICASYIFLFAYAIISYRKEKEKLLNLLLNFSLLIFFIALVLILFEFAFRTVLKQYVPVNLYGYNEYIGNHWCMPNLNEIIKTNEYSVNFRTNKYGFRDNFDMKPKKDGEIRILNSGDSFIMAAEVELENTMSYKLEKYLNENEKENYYKVVNFSLTGTSPSWYKGFFEEKLNLFNPDYLIMYLYVGNDVSDELHGINTIKDTTGETNIFNTIINSTINNLARFSNFIAFLYGRTVNKNYFDDFPMGRPCQPFDGKPEETSSNVFLINYNKDIKGAFDKLLSSTQELNQVCKSKNVKLVVALIPTKEQVEKDKLNEVINFFKIDTSAIDMKKPQKLISDFLNQNQIINIDLLDTLFEASKTGKPYFDFDSHWNVYGNDVVAGKMNKFLKENILKK
jgi:hypothetical protein